MRHRPQLRLELQNFGNVTAFEHQDRYARAEEFADVHRPVQVPHRLGAIAVAE